MINTNIFISIHLKEIVHIQWGKSGKDMKKTKEIIIDAFWQLLEEKPFNKITVQNIVERCHLNRNTFYYHFQDIPNLAEYTVKSWADQIIQNNYEFGSPMTCLVPLIEECNQHKKAFQHLYNSSQKDEFITYMNHVALHIVKMFMKQSSHYVLRSEQEKETLLHFYKCLMIGILIDWLEAQGDYDLKPFVEQIFHLICPFYVDINKTIVKVERRNEYENLK